MRFTRRTYRAAIRKYLALTKPPIWRGADSDMLMRLRWRARREGYGFIL